MTINIAINGLGRIGRCIVRALTEENQNDLKLVAVNGRGPIETHHHLLKYDSIHGRYKGEVSIDTEKHSLNLNGQEIKVYREREPENIPWKNHDIDIVLECTGAFKDKESASKHIKAGAKKVIISAPPKDDTKMIVYGVNHHEKITDSVISIGSCTTNCLAPIAKVINDSVGIEKGFVTTIHAVTNDQNVTDATHSDLRRARASYLSMIPTSTGAAKAIGKVIPELDGKLDGTAIRVPTANVSLIDLCFQASKKTNISELNKIIKDAAKADFKNIIEYADEPTVSIDYNQSSFSAIYDSTATKILQDDFIRIAAWYDNEWGFSMRMLDIAKLIGK